MDVEAQEDGVLAKITLQDGAKSVKVGSRIAVMAEQGDDLQSLEMPAEAPLASSPAASAPPKPDTTAQQQQPSSKASQPERSSKSPPSPTGKTQNQKYPLYPSVAALLHQHNLSPSEVRATGPSGRLLKGDVLSHLGRIDPSYSSAQSTRISQLAHLDLSNIKLATPAPKPPPPSAQAQPSKAAEASAAAEEEQASEIAVPVCLQAVLATQKRVRDSLGIQLPLSTFVTRASEIANRDLPAVKSPPSADELFNSVLGLDGAKGAAGARRTSRGHYIPQVTALPPSPPPFRAGPNGKSDDIVDLLTGRSSRKARAPAVPAAAGVLSKDGSNVFSLSVRRGEERRARTYLERVKSVLEVEPGRCVL